MSYEITTPGDYLLVRLFGTVVAGDLHRFGTEIDRIEDANPRELDRIVDFTGVTEFAVGFEIVNGLARQRRERKFRTPVKLALVVVRPSEFGFARMYQTLNDNPQMTIRILASREEAIAWFAEPTADRPLEPPL
jgi:hypothetical protein